MTPLLVVGTRTHPLDSCITIAKMKRGSSPDEDPMLWMADLMSLISCAESSAAFHCAQETFMLGVLLWNAESKSIHWSWLGHPAAGEPLPVYIL